MQKVSSHINRISHPRICGAFLPVRIILVKKKTMGRSEFELKKTAEYGSSQVNKLIKNPACYVVYCSSTLLGTKQVGTLLDTFLSSP